MIKSLSLTTIALVSATSATAQGVEHLSYGANFTNISSGGGSVDLFSIGATVDYRVNNAFVGGSLAYADVSAGGSERFINLSARGGYFITPQAVIYGGIQHFDASSLGNYSSYDLGAEYSFGAFTVGLNYDDSDEAGYIETTTLYASYRPTDAMEVALGVSDIDGETITQIGLDYDNGQYEISTLYANSDGSSLFGLDAAYDFGNSFRVSGNYSNFDGDADALSIGGGYEVSSDMWIDLEFGRIDAVGGGSADVIGLAFTYETGEEILLIDRARTTQVEALGVLGQISTLGGF